MAVTNILQWNVNSLKARRQELLNFLSKTKNIPDIICMQETLLKPGKTFNLPGYISIRNDRINKPKGGVATFIKTGTNYSVLQLPASLECVGLKILSGKQELNIINLYVPPTETIDTTVLCNLFKLNNTIITGDLNGHNPLWGSKNININGRLIEDLLDQHNFSVINTGEPTYQIYTGAMSHLDITLVSNNLATKCKWSVYNDLMGSDHAPTLTTLNDFSISDPNMLPKYIFSKADWKSFASRCQETFKNNISSEDPIVFYNNLVKSIIDAADMAVPKTRGRKRTKVKCLPYWTEELKMAISDRNTARNRLTKTNSESDGLKYKKLKGIAQYKIKSAAKTHWRNFCSSLTENSRLRDVWSMAKKFNGIYSELQNCDLKQKGQIYNTPRDKAELIAEAFTNTSSDSNYSDKFKNQKTEAENNFKLYEQTNSSQNLANNLLNENFSLQELQRAINQLKDHSSPGLDNISYELIKKLPRKGQKLLCKLYNLIWSTGILPPAWKHSIILPFPKKDKDPSNPTSYRPISLTSTLCKLMEKLVTNRLTWHMEKNNLLTNIQSGFRQNRNTMDHVIRLSDTINKYINNNGYTLGVFLDFEKAYDMVWRPGLLHKLQKFGIDGPMLNWIQDFLSNRTFQVRLGNTLSTKHTLTNGIAQGSVISCLLFLIYINDFPTKPNDTESSLFADDSAIFKSGRNLKYISTHLQRHLNDIETWCDTWGIKLSTSKSVGVLFTNKLLVNIEPPLTLNGAPLKMATSVKFLGLIFDHKLTWLEHAQYIDKRCKTRLNFMRGISGTEWGSDKTTLLTIYKTLIRPVIDYGATAYDCASDTTKKIIDKIQSRALRICCGAMPSTSIAAMQNECGENPLKYRRLEAQIKQAIKIKTLPNHPAKDILEDHWTLFYGNFRSQREPMAVKIKDFFEINKHSYEEIEIQPSPPWLLKTVEIDLSISERINKKDTPDIVKSVALEHIDDYKYYKHIYTDGSKLDNIVATAYIVPEHNIEFSARLTDCLSVYTAELIAIREALGWIQTNENTPLIPPDTKFAILSDCKSALETLQSGRSKSRPNLTKQILEIINLINSNITLVWIPAHVNILNNEAVDKLAKSALHHPQIDLEIRLEKEEMTGIVQNYIDNKWQEDYGKLPGSSHYKSITPFVNRKIKYTNKCRKKEVLITRLRLGKCKLNWYLHEIHAHPDGLCFGCKTPETIKHYLLECPNSAVQPHLTKICREQDIELTIAAILTNNTTIDVIVKHNNRRL
jgi:exonuclease III/ribonuclease HI